MSDNPFASFRSEIVAETPLRAAMTLAARQPEPECVPPLLALAELKPGEAERVDALARRLVTRLRAKTRTSGVEGLIHEYSLSSQEGVALMCLAEALLRIPDAETRDALIRDKLGPADWRAHLGNSPSLVRQRRDLGPAAHRQARRHQQRAGLGAALTRLIARGGEPIIRAGVDLAMRLMGEQFVTGRPSRRRSAPAASGRRAGFAISYDMLGEAATTAEDAARYLADYEQRRSTPSAAPRRGRGVYEGPGISIKLSALHPRYSRVKRDARDGRTAAAPEDARRARAPYDIGLNIDAEEADRLELSLDLLEALASIPTWRAGTASASWFRPIGKRCAVVIDWLIDLARRTRAAADGPAGQRRLLGQRDQARAGRRAWRISRSSPARSTPTSPTSPARASCWPRQTRCSRSSPPTTPRPWPR